LVIVTVKDNHRQVATVSGVSPGTPRYVESLAFLVSQVGAHSARQFAGMLEPLGVSPGAYGVLSHVAVEEGRTQQQIADALGIHRNNMVGLIDELEGAGWVRRQRNQQDRRAFEIRLTASGRALVRRVDRLIPRLDEEIGHALSAAERRRMIDLLQRVAAAAGLSSGVHPHLRARSGS
jgi:DNA-binding MarR family transcriptional regulator